MPTVDLGRAELALLSDLAGTRVVIQQLQVLVPTRTYRQVLVGPFEGDTLPLGFRGDGQSRSWQMTARYGAHQHADMEDLLELFDAAHNGVDGRMLLRTHLGDVGGINESQAVMVSEVSTAWSRPKLADVSFTAHAVAWSATL